MSQDPTRLREIFFSLLEENRIMTLATFGEEGPWAAPVIYAWETHSASVALYFMSRLSTRHVKNLLEAPRVAAAIHPNETRPLRGLQAEGTVEMLRGKEALHVIRIYLRRFPLARRRFPIRTVLEESLDLRFFRFLPERVYILSEEHFGWGNRYLIELSTGAVSQATGWE
ncbi:MAG: pyridoxamine 5'-phosphate oxidase family protein [Candidatus Methylomirabilales bacterium]